MLVVTEVTYLLGTRLGTEAEVRFLGDLASGNLIAEPVAASDWLRIAELTSTYGDLPLGAVDASVVVAGERLGITQLATLDRRHFTVVRPAHVDAFELLPQGRPYCRADAQLVPGGSGCRSDGDRPSAARPSGGAPRPGIEPGARP
jgi:hypothetical protein